jgi:antitoxin VapB
MNAPFEPKTERTARLFKNGRSQAVRIPKEMEFEGEEVVMTKIGDELIIKPKHKKIGLLALLATLEPLDANFPDIDDDLPSLEEGGCFDDLKPGVSEDG